MTALILASASPRRLQLLAQMGVAPKEVVAAAIDETPKKGEKPKALAERLAREKCRKVMTGYADCLVLAGDTVVACGRRILPKAGSAEDVKAFLILLSGRRHHVYSALSLAVPGGRLIERLSDSVVQFKHLTPAEIESYAASGEGIGKAGGYAIQGRAAGLVKWISGSYGGIVGLPLFEVSEMLRLAGEKHE